MNRFCYNCAKFWKQMQIKGIAMQITQKLKNSLKNFGELVVFKHTIFSSTFLLVAVTVAFTQISSTINAGFIAKTLILCALALIFARNFAMAFNRFCDTKFDAINPRTSSRPSVDGRISPNALLGFTIANALGFIATSFFINTLAFALSLPFLLIIGAYSYFKRFSALAHFVLGISLALAPIAGVVAVMGAIPLWSVFLSLGVAFWVAGFDLLYSLQDIEFDKANGLFSIPSVYGLKATIFISRFSHIMAVIFWALFARDSGGGIFAYLGVISAFAMLIYEHYLVAKDLLNIPKAFFQTNGYLGVVFLAFILLDCTFKGLL